MDYFKPDAKCCTYHPGLANYLVGAILADEGPELEEGRRRIRAKIAARIGVTPMYIQAPRKYSLIYSAARGAGFFGRAKSMMCPYFDADRKEGSCTVWRYREAVCSTYFCKYTAGKPGWEFWDMLKGYLGYVERSLARFSMKFVDPTVKEPVLERMTLTAEDVEDLAPKDADYAVYWGNWVGREEEFYIACYRHAMSITPNEFNINIDDTPDGRGMLGRLTAKYDAIPSAELPRSLVRATNLKKRVNDETVVVTSYNPYDAFSVEKELFDVIGMFKADQTVEENLARLDKDHDVQLAPELLHYLFVHGLLVAPEPVKEVKPAPVKVPLPVHPLLAKKTSRKQRRAASAAAAASAAKKTP